MRPVVDTIKALIKKQKNDSPNKVMALNLLHLCLMQSDNEDFLFYTEKKLLKRLIILARFRKVIFWYKTWTDGCIGVKWIGEGSFVVWENIQQAGIFRFLEALAAIHLKVGNYSCCLLKQWEANWDQQDILVAPKRTHLFSSGRDSALISWQ